MTKRLVKVCVSGLFLISLCLTAQPVNAQGWNYDAGLYLFALGMDGSMKVRGQEADVDIGFSDILDELKTQRLDMTEVNKRWLDEYKKEHGLK